MSCQSFPRGCADVSSLLPEMAWASAPPATDDRPVLGTDGDDEKKNACLSRSSCPTCRSTSSNAAWARAALARSGSGNASSTAKSRRPTSQTRHALPLHVHQQATSGRASPQNSNAAPAIQERVHHAAAKSWLTSRFQAPRCRLKGLPPVLQVAIKFEPHSSKGLSHAGTPHEWGVYAKLGGLYGIPRIFARGQAGSYFVMVLRSRTVHSSRLCVPALPTHAAPAKA